MLDSFLAGLEEICEVCHTKSIEVRILGRDRAFPARCRALAVYPLPRLDAVYPLVAATSLDKSRHVEQSVRGSRMGGGREGWWCGRMWYGETAAQQDNGGVAPSLLPCSCAPTAGCSCCILGRQMSCVYRRRIADAERVRSKTGLVGVAEASPTDMKVRHKSGV